MANFLAEYLKKEHVNREDFLATLNLKANGSQSVIEFPDENGLMQSILSDNLDVVSKSISRKRPNSSLSMTNTLVETLPENVPANLKIVEVIDPVLLPNTPVEDISVEPSSKRRRISSQEIEESTDIIADNARVPRKNVCITFGQFRINRRLLKQSFFYFLALFSFLKFK